MGVASKPEQHYVDLHVHVGRAGGGRAVKITASPSLTVPGILATCRDEKGIGIVGIVDCASPAVLADLHRLVVDGVLEELPGGGLSDGSVTAILGVEVETAGGEGPSHHVGYVAGLSEAWDLSAYLAEHIHNTTLSSQRADFGPADFAHAVGERGGFVVPAHVFTPYKSVFGRAATRLSSLFSGEVLAHVAAVELGLSADTELADRIGELHDYTFLTNSDAHSLGKIGREYSKMTLDSLDFSGLRAALSPRDGGGVLANYGLDPKLGKYHRTFCLRCEQCVEGPPPRLSCERCGSADVVRGVLDRIETLADLPPGSHPSFRPPYVYRVPLDFIPGVGPAKRRRLVQAFGSELKALEASEPELAEVVGEAQARLIRGAQERRLHVATGGGGVYGRLRVDD